MPAHTIGEIATALGAEAAGNLELRVRGVQEPARAADDELAIAVDGKFAEALRDGDARAAILWSGADWLELGLEAAIFAPAPRLAFAHLTHVFDAPPDHAPGIHPTALVDPSAVIGEASAIGPFTIVGPSVRIGANARISGHCSIGPEVEIGPDARVHEGVRILARTRIGAEFRCHANTVIGADGFAYVTPDPEVIDRAKATGEVAPTDTDAGLVRINSLGNVLIGDGVEIGANAVIDRGTIASTVIGDGSKLDNLVHVAHNVTIGRSCLICAQVGFGGSAVLGDRVFLAGQVGVGDHVVVGSDVVVAGKSGVSSNVPSGRIMMGNPAMKMDLNVESYKALRRLPRLFKKVAKLEALLASDAGKQ